MTSEPAGRALLDPEFKGQSKRTGTAALVIIAIVIVVGGVAYLTPATIGVGLIALGCFLAILARLHQAS